MNAHDKHDQILMKLGAVAVLAAFTIETATNAIGGMREAGFGMALLLMSIAVFGALCGVLFRRSDSKTMKGVYLAAGFLCFLVSQIAGNSVFSSMLADGNLRRNVQATSGEAARDQLARLRDEQKKIGIQRPSQTVRDAANLECKKVSRQFPDGVGPACTELKKELGLALRSEELPALIEAQSAKVLGGPQKQGGEGFDGQLKWMFAQTVGAPGDDDLRRGLIMFVVFVLGLVANIGPAILLGGTAGPAVASGAGGRGAQDFFGDVFGQEMALAGSGALIGASGADAKWASEAHQRSKPIQIGRMRQLPPPPRRERLTGAAEVLSPAAGGSSGGATATGAPVTINIGGINRDGAVDVDAASGPSYAPRRRGDQPAMPPRHDVGAVPDAPPADRTSINAITDKLLAFRAACVVDVTGGHVTASDLYRRYVAWCGSGALGDAAFHALFGDVTGVARHDVAGQLHYRGVALRAPSLAAVG